MPTVAGTLRRLIVDAALSGPTPSGGAVSINQRVFRDSAPEGATLPYVTFVDAVSKTPAIKGDGAVIVQGRLMQVDLWQRHRDESDDLLHALETAVDGARLDLGVYVSRTRLQSTTRLPDPDAALVHHALTVLVQHDRAAR